MIQQREADVTLGRIDAKSNYEDCGYTSPCYIWQGAMRHDGYPVFWVASTTAARRLYEIIHDVKVPHGSHVHHLCHQKLCLNPAHLEVMPNTQHIRKHHLKIPDEDVPEIVAEIEAAAWGQKGKVTQAIAERYGVAFQTAQKLKYGTRKHLLAGASVQ